VATAPAWGFDLRDDTRTVLTTGLTTGLEGQRPPVARALSSEAWTQLRAETRRHHLDGLLVAAVARGALPATDAQQAELAALEIELTRARMWHEQRMVEIVGSLETAGIAVRVLKGPALAALDYPDRQWRPTSDLDLLVRGDQIDAADALLTSLGGVRTDPDPVPGFTAVAGKGATLAMPDGLEVDLHRLLVYGPLGVRLPPEELWRTSRPFEAGGQHFETLGLEETLLHACLHVLVLGWRRALGPRDIAQVLTNPAFDADRAIPLSRRWGAEAVLATGVLLAHRELGLADDLPVLDWARGLPLRWRDRLWLRIERPDDPVAGIEAVATYAELRTAAERRVLRAATLHPAPGTWSSPVERVEWLARRARQGLTSPFR
jgi:hypothetical protein